ncbi:MAG: type I DNA topoisomerase [Anaerolineae bacterium]
MQDNFPVKAKRRTGSRKPARAKTGAKRTSAARRRSSASADDFSPLPLDGGEGEGGGAGVPLVIVESPAKAKTIGRFLGRGYRVRASVGHIRDLPERQMGVDIEQGFKPHYVITPKKRDVVQELKALAHAASAIYLATDPDREGEAISWHLVQALDKDIRGKPVHRVEFHEITQDAIRHAFAQPRILDMDLVNAQQARRVLDRIVGYTISPLLRKKMTKKGLSAGRVQSVAVRLVVEREREIQNFTPVEYWSIEAELAKQAAAPEPAVGVRLQSQVAGPTPQVTAPNSAVESFHARLVKINDKDFECHSGLEAHRLKETLEKCDYGVLEVRRKDILRNPAPPFITSTLQQAASRKLGFNAKRTMAAAQQLYEGLPIGAEGNVGLITYMRTDSTHVAESAQKEAGAFIQQTYGESYLPKTPRLYSKKVAGAQEAHEAIRPTQTFREPQAIRAYLNADQYRLYELIWKRFVASQMASAIFDTTAVDIAANRQPADHLLAPSTANLETRPSPVPEFLFRANGSILKFLGFLKVYGRATGDQDEEEDADKRLPPLVKDEPLDLLGIFPEQHFTEPPPRYTEATLIKALEQFGIGRPSTYAPILSHIQERDYIEQIENRRLRPTDLGFTVNDLLVAHFPEIVDVGFTAKMEEQLDAVAEGKQEWVQLLGDFYTPFKQSLDRAASEMPAMHLGDEKTDIRCDKCGSPMVVKHGKFGKFLSCSRFPKCKNAKSPTTGVPCPECKQGELAEKKSRQGKTFYSCSRYPDCKFATWDRPVLEPCPKCGGLMVDKGKGGVACLKGDYRRTQEIIPKLAEV